MNVAPLMRECASRPVNEMAGSVNEISYSAYRVPGAQPETEKMYRAPAKRNHLVIHKTAPQVSPPKPPSSKYKVSISQINGLAFISLLFIPLFWISLLLPPATGSILALTCLIVGPLLALISYLMAQKRRGTWVVGIAAGFWALMLIYLALLFFIF